MISVVMGLSAALFWGVGTLLLRSASKLISPHAIAFWFAAYNTVLVIVPASFVFSRDGARPATVALGVAAGVATTIAIGSESRALNVGDVVTVAPLVALEGAAAAVLGILLGDPVSALIGAGLALCVVGGLGVGLPKGFRVTAPGVGWALVAAGMFGVSLWVIGGTQTSIWVLLLIMNLFGAIVLGAIFRRELHPRQTPPKAHAAMLLLAAMNIGGMVAFAIGAKAGSLPVTAVLAAQFAIPAIAGGYLLHGERLAGKQIAGAAVLLAGVAFLALGTS